MKNKIFLIVLIMFFSTNALGATFQGRIGGTVGLENSAGMLSGVRVSVQFKGKLEKNAALTDAAGGFTVDIRQVFSEQTNEGGSLSLVCEKTNYYRVVKVLDTGSTSINLEHLKIIMIPISGASTVTDEESKKIGKYYSGTGRTLYITPYQFVGTLPSLDMDRFAENLYDTISNGLRPWLQALPGVNLDISVQSIPDIDTASTNMEKMYQYGHILNGLAIIAGNGEFYQEENGQETVFLRSRFITIPHIPPLRPGTVKLDDIFPSTMLNSLMLSDRLNKYWSAQTGLAICVSEYKKASAMQEKERREKALEQVRIMIIACRSDIDPDNPLLASQFEHLRDIVDGELQK